LGQSWFVPSRSALFAVFESRGVIVVVSGIFVIYVVFVIVVVVAVFAVLVVVVCRGNILR
jgi:hypothetical protein